MSITTEQAAAWFADRAKNTPMPGAREMFEMAASALREKAEREYPEPPKSGLRRMKKDQLIEYIYRLKCHIKRYESLLAEQSNVYKSLMKEKCKKCMNERMMNNDH